MDYEKPKEGRRALARILGNGTPPASQLIWSELIKYVYQVFWSRKVMLLET